MARVTRSQSREQEAPKYQNEGLKSNGYQQASADRLSTVAESPQTPGRKASVPTAAIVPESPGNHEGNSALSGTTIHHASDSEDEPEALDALDMLDELPDLQQAAGSLLDLLISSNSDPISIFNAAKRIRDTDAKRVKRHSKKLLERMRVYTQEIFIDVSHVKSQIPVVSTKNGIHSWGPSPALHLSNCARLALDILLENAGSTSTLQAVRSLDSQFPAPFLDEVTDSTRSMAIGTSAAEKATFELALEIRTQFFIMELERRQTEPQFDPKAVLMYVFYNHCGLDPVEVGVLRGFNLAGAFEEEDGSLPDRFQDAVAERIRELEVEMFDDDDALNIKGLRAAFSWKRFVLRAANFIYQREREIRRDLQTQASFDEVKTSVSKEIRKRDDPNWIDPADRRESVAPSSAPRSSRPPLAPSSRATSRPRSITRTPEREERETAAMLYSSAISQKSATPQKLPDWHNHDMPPPRTPVVNPSPQRPAQGTEGSSRQQSAASMPESRSETTAVSHASPAQNSIEQGSLGAGPSKRSIKKKQKRKSLGLLNDRSVAEAHHILQDIDDNKQENAQPASEGRRTLYDRQSGARRISPIGDSQTPSSEKVSKSVEAPSRKRTRQETEESEDQYHCATIDSSDIAHQRLKKPKQKRQVRRRVDDRSESGSTSNEPNNQLQSSLDEITEPATQAASAPDQPPAQPSGDPPGTPPGWDDHHAPRRVQPGRVRSGRGWWTEERSDRLVDLIAVHGTKWKSIVDDDAEYPASKGGPMFTPRSSDGTKFQVALKDHARVLKGRYIMNKEPLPTNFNLVADPKKVPR